MTKQIPAWRRATIALAMLAAGVLLASCSGGDSDAAPATTAATATVASAGSPQAIATPRMLPVTPVSIDYAVADPSFEALDGARAISGEYEGGGYQIEVPDNWNGDVVYFAHGFRGNPPALTVGPPPIREHLIARGFAWAASSYTKNGYEPGAGARDTLALQKVVADKVGTPRRQYIYGQSMGGHVVTLSLEQYPDAYDGALSECGVVSGHEILDYFLSWGVLSSHFAGIDLYDSTREVGEFGSIINGTVVPALGNPDEPTAAGDRFIDVIERMTGGPRAFFLEGLKANYNFNFVILVNAVGAAGPANAASQNINARYDIDPALGVTADELNRQVPRVIANESFRDPARYPEFADMTGEIEAPLLTLHGTGDLFVPMHLEQSYRRTVDAAGNGDLLVQRAIRRPGHCSFSAEERTQAFDDLVAWVETGVKARGEDITGDLREAGREFTRPALEDDPGTLTAR